MYKTKSCSNCGREIAENAIICPNCGAPARDIHGIRNIPANASDKDWLATLLFCFFLGGLGIHSFYAGKTAVGIIQLLTLGGCGIWALIDLILIIVGSYKDGEGRPIVNKR